MTPLQTPARGAFSMPFWCLCQKLSLSLFLTWIKLCYTKALEWSSLVPGPEVKSPPSESTSPTLFAVGDPCCCTLLQSHCCGLVAQSCHVWPFVTPWTAACQASLSFSVFWSFLKLMSSESVMPSNHLILCLPLLLLPLIFPSIRVFSNKSALHIRWPEYWSFGFNISPSNEHQDWFPLGWTGWIS